MEVMHRLPSGVLDWNIIVKQNHGDEPIKLNTSTFGKSSFRSTFADLRKNAAKFIASFGYIPDSLAEIEYRYIKWVK